MLLNRRKDLYSTTIGHRIGWLIPMLVLSLTLLLGMAITSSAITPLADVNALTANVPSTDEVVGAAGVASLSVIHSDLGPDQMWTVRRYGNSQSISHGFGSPIRITEDITDNGLSESAIRFVRQNEEALGFAGVDLIISSITSPPNYKVVSISANIEGISIYDAYVILSINERGELALLKARGFSNRVTGSFSIGLQRAIDHARTEMNAPNGEVTSNRVYFPVIENNRISLTPAYQIEINTPNPSFQPRAFIDAGDGTLLAAENRIHFVELAGTTNGMYHPMYGVEEPEQGLFPDERLNINGNNLFSDENAEFIREVDGDDLPVDFNAILRGRWVDVQVWDEDEADYNPNGSINLEIEDVEEAVEIVWDDETSFEAERDLFFHVNRAHTFWKELVPNWNRMDYPILAVCNLGGEGMEGLEDNAFSSGQGIFFGRGNQFDNFATYADVVYHEYAHTVTARVYGGNPLPYQGESGALNEAWSDYFACTLTNEPQIGEGGLLGENRVMRDLDNNLVYPDNLVGEVHADARIIAAAMWHTRVELGAEYCDLLFHNARFHYAREFETYLMDVLITDDDNGDLTDGTPNYEAIYDAFNRHGINPLGVQAYGLSEISFSDNEEDGAEGNGDGILDPGETISVSLSVFRGGRIEGQNGEETIIRMRTTHEGIDVFNNDIAIEDLAMGNRLPLPEPIQFDIMDNVEISFAEIVFLVSSDGLRFAPLDTMRIVLGTPSLLIVKDGSDGIDRTQWIRDPLDELELIYAEYETAGNRFAEDEYFTRFNSIIVYSGDSREDLLGEDLQVRLMDYIDLGGNVLLTGQYFDEVDEGGQLLFGYFGAITELDSLRGIGMSGVDGDPVTDGINLIFAGDGASNQRSPGSIETFGDGEPIFHWDRIDGGNRVAGVRMDIEDAEARTVYLSFGLEAVGVAGNFNSRAEITQSILSWFDREVGVSDEVTTPIAFEIGQAYPNPYNSRINYPFSLTRTGLVNIKIYNSVGRVLFNETNYRRSGAQLWSLNSTEWGAGVYFVKLQAEGKTKVSRITFLK